MLSAQLEKIELLIKKSRFTPTLFNIFINPFYFTKKGLYKGIKMHTDSIKGVMLDFGCGNKPYKNLFKVDKYIGLDIEKSGHDHKNEKIDFYYDGKKIPFQDNYFDSIFSSEVFEHIPNINEILNELNRVLKKDGRILITVPFVWYEHECPYDYLRYTSFGIKHLLESKGFRTISIKKTTNYIETIFQIINSYIYIILFPQNKFIKIILSAIIITPITSLGILLSKILPNNPSFFLNNIILAEKYTDI